MTTTVRIPGNFAAYRRGYQREAMRYFDGFTAGRNQGRGVYCWARRTGKDAALMHQTAKMALLRKANYLHLLPTAAHARRIIWDGIDHLGSRMIDTVFPLTIRDGPINEQLMRIKLKSGSTWQLGGADYFNAMVGGNPVGIVFSEYALIDSRAWHFFRPILAQNKGWAAFISTPRGYNSFHELLEIAKREPGWDTSTVTALEAGTMTEADIAREIHSGMPEELARQEYLCDFSAANVGSILGRYVEAAEREDRIHADQLYDPEGAPIEVSCDLGFRDAAAFWWWQPRYDGYALIDYDEDIGLDASGWIERIRSHGYHIGTLWLPHDARAKTFQSGRSVFEHLLQAGFNCRMTPEAKVHDRINAGRSVLARCHFAVPACDRGLATLRSWAYEYDEERKVMSQNPRHDQFSDGADAFTYGAIVMRERLREQPKLPPQVRSPGSFRLDELWETRPGGRYA